jgi:hypothetical protein
MLLGGYFHFFKLHLLCFALLLGEVIINDFTLLGGL